VFAGDITFCWRTEAQVPVRGIVGIGWEERLCGHFWYTWFVSLQL
jgi:hypothetical protein